MAASAGTNPGSTPEGVGVAVGSDVGVGVGVGESLAGDVGEGDASGGDPEPLGVDVGAVLTTAAEVHPARTIAMAIAAQA
jgi:hypothetical protein